MQLPHLCYVCTQFGGYQVTIRVQDNSTEEDVHHFSCPLKKMEIHERSEVIVCMEDFVSVSEVE